MRYRATIVSVLFVLAVPALALPDYSSSTVYFDEEGNEIGYRTVACSGQVFTSGSTSDIYTYEIIEYCRNIEPITCEDVGLSSMSGCPTSWCVTEGYALSYSFNLVMDCNGTCICNGNPACGVGTSTCNGATRHTRPSKVLRARLDDEETTCMR